MRVVPFTDWLGAKNRTFGGVPPTTYVFVLAERGLACSLG